MSVVAVDDLAFDSQPYLPYVKAGMPYAGDHVVLQVDRSDCVVACDFDVSTGQVRKLPLSPSLPAGCSPPDVSFELGAVDPSGTTFAFTDGDTHGCLVIWRPNGSLDGFAIGGRRLWEEIVLSDDMSTLVKLSRVYLLGGFVSMWITACEVKHCAYTRINRDATGTFFTFPKVIGFSPDGGTIFLRENDKWNPLIARYYACTWR